eukprot:TRINITY_DN3844_c0_g1_i1.p1 TRINITY_DN3844_c0_g1~~TRINITY_DN3844_c0_g1_i1.p1  ORF type:complete len:285 (-),score=49.18 TRINITY_DN3844_c0_g1_i1:160-1014(-)
MDVPLSPILSPDVSEEAPDPPSPHAFELSPPAILSPPEAPAGAPLAPIVAAPPPPASWPWGKKVNRKPSGKSSSSPKANKNSRGESSLSRMAGSRKSQKVNKSQTSKAKLKTTKSKNKKKKKKKKKKESQVVKISAYKHKGWAYRLVKTGKKTKTSGGLTKQDLMYNANGRVVSKKRSKRGKKLYVEHHLDLWAASLLEARAKNNITGFVKIQKNGDDSTTSLHKEVYSLWKKKLAERMGKLVSSAGGDDFRAEMNGYLKDHGLVLNSLERQPTRSSSASSSRD